LTRYNCVDEILGVPVLENFWQSVKADDPHRQFGAMPPVEKYRSAVPIYIHGDGVEYQDRDSIKALHWGSVAASLSPLVSGFLIAAFPKSCTGTEQDSMESTWQNICRTIVHSLQACVEGTWPERDSAGRPFLLTL